MKKNVCMNHNNALKVMKMTGENMYEQIQEILDAMDSGSRSYVGYVLDVSDLTDKDAKTFHKLLFNMAKARAAMRGRGYQIGEFSLPEVSLKFF